ncbi:unnamed protein product [Polarella glacialis]|uniref:V-type proton ATPase subunit G n=1 Tax=Polarella glacialis TaxID=89957 RepID=A0A813LXY7_POLGL|nr:unnamed protein product [Polarella glacialis]
MALIEQLLVAEKQADEIVANAKKNRLTKLKQAREKADEELKDFREKEEAKFQKDCAVKAKADPNESLKATTLQEIEKVINDYATNKGRCVEFVVGKVLDVATSLTSTQKQALQTGTVETNTSSTQKPALQTIGSTEEKLDFDLYG